MKIAGVQMDIEIANVEANLERMQQRVLETTAAGALLTVFPECTTTGYCLDSLDEVKSLAENLEGPSISRVRQWCRQLSTMVVFGFLEQVDERIYNSVALVGPTGTLGVYRKVHLPFLGLDRFTTPGDRLGDVSETPQVRIGMNICYDISFPESARILTLQGAELIVLPTNWPPTSKLAAEVIPNTRALENHVYFMAINRIGNERGFEFIGKSKICDPHGNNLAFADHAEEAILYADIEPVVARQKHLVSIPGQHEIHRVNDRRPELYGGLTHSMGTG